MTDLVNHPPHYKGHASGIEVIEITRGLEFTLGNAVKYILRHAKKQNPKQDIEKAAWYVNDILESDNLPFWPDEPAVRMVDYLAADRLLPYDESLGEHATGALLALLVGQTELALTLLKDFADLLD